jgi:hypothetical protein
MGTARIHEKEGLLIWQHARLPLALVIIDRCIGTERTSVRRNDVQ